MRSSDRSALRLESSHGRITLFTNGGDPVEGDVLLCFPKRGIVQRIFRRESRQNTILFTERCDQLCVMCSQSPKNKEYSWLFPLYEKAMTLFDPGTVVGISGGEPTLYKVELFGVIEQVAGLRPDLSFHVLTNGQHFSIDDRKRLAELHKCAEIVWGILTNTSSRCQRHCENDR